jgi:hypothetical protein
VSILFFEEDDLTVTVTSDRYCAMLENFLWPKLDDLFAEHGAEMCGLNKMVQQPTHLVVRSEFSEKCFLIMLSPCVVTLGGCRVRQISPRAMFFSGATSKPRYNNIVPKP